MQAADFERVWPLFCPLTCSTEVAKCRSVKSFFGCAEVPDHQQKDLASRMQDLSQRAADRLSWKEFPGLEAQSNG
jgi:hypothetical protein